jgi:hypothetical protein
MHEDDDVEVRRHRRKRPGMAAGEMAAGRHDRASRQAVHPYTAASAVAIREARGEDWRPEARQDSWSSAAHMEPLDPVQSLRGLLPHHIWSHGLRTCP